MHQKNIKLNVFINKDYVFGLFLIGYDGTLKKTYKVLTLNNIIKNIESMPMGSMEVKKNNKHLSLYDNYHPKSSIKGLGFKDEKNSNLYIRKNKKSTIKISIKCCCNNVKSC